MKFAVKRVSHLRHETGSKHRKRVTCHATHPPCNRVFMRATAHRAATLPRGRARSRRAWRLRARCRRACSRRARSRVECGAVEREAVERGAVKRVAVERDPVEWDAVERGAVEWDAVERAAVERDADERDGRRSCPASARDSASARRARAGSETLASGPASRTCWVRERRSHLRC